MKNWQERTALLVGEETLARFEAARVIIVGAGGVGAYAAEMLVRAGIGHMVLIDSDVVSPSNINRQLLALHSTVGRSKVQVLKQRLLDINPDAEIEAMEQYLTPEEIPLSLAKAARLGSDPTEGSDPNQLVVVDAIDTLAPKLALINFCVKNGIRHVSSMGSGAKFDITKIRIADISKSYNCPLAYIVRKRLRREYGISKGFPVVFSEELPSRDAIIAEEGRNKKSNVGTISYLPAAFGCACAQAVIGLIGV